MNENQLLEWQFDELVKTLIVLSYPADKQIEAMGLGQVADEMALDFENYYSNLYPEYIQRKWITTDQKIALDKLDQFLRKKSGKKNFTFWENSQLSIHPDWEKIRKMAKEILILLHKDHLTVEVTIKNETIKDENGEELTIQQIITNLINKK